MELNGRIKKLGIFSDKHVPPIPHLCCQNNSVDGEGEVVFHFMFCFKNNTEETIHLSSLLLLKMESEDGESDLEHYYWAVIRALSCSSESWGRFEGHHEGVGDAWEAGRR